MNGPFDVRYTDDARDDLHRLYDFLLDRAQVIEDLDAAQDAIDALQVAIEGQLRRAPFSCRKIGNDPFLRELVIAFKSTGYVALFEINGDRTVDVLAIRHQREDDYH